MQAHVVVQPLVGQQLPKHQQQRVAMVAQSPWSMSSAADRAGVTTRCGIFSRQAATILVRLRGPFLICDGQLQPSASIVVSRRCSRFQAESR